MRPNTSMSRSALLLTELLIAVLFFALAAAVCLQVLAGSHRLTKKTEALSFAVLQTSSAAELLSRDLPGADLETMAACLSRMGAFEEREGLQLGYDGALGPCPVEAASYVLSVRAGDGDLPGVTDYTLVFEETGEETVLYTLELSLYTPEKGGRA